VTKLTKTFRGKILLSWGMEDLVIDELIWGEVDRLFLRPFCCRRAVIIEIADTISPGSKRMRGLMRRILPS